ncbi:hypothetical protein A9255_04160 [Xenorhabdus hominickii]|uniref:Uncharacterized protein n=1 Tax=Xenorhabdus hominickii TaxID=351679 RepID=A0ABM6DPL6_XENHO|nr:hypothetical protein A9255_04160 [Xenorhabdus hominickii]
MWFVSVLQRKTVYVIAWEQPLFIGSISNRFRVAARRQENKSPNKPKIKIFSFRVVSKFTEAGIAPIIIIHSIPYFDLLYVVLSLRSGVIYLRPMVIGSIMRYSVNNICYIFRNYLYIGGDIFA